MVAGLIFGFWMWFGSLIFLDPWRTICIFCFVDRIQDKVTKKMKIIALMPCNESTARVAKLIKATSGNDQNVATTYYSRWYAERPIMSLFSSKMVTTVILQEKTEAKYMQAAAHGGGRISVKIISALKKRIQSSEPVQRMFHTTEECL